MSAAETRTARIESSGDRPRVGASKGRLAARVLLDPKAQAQFWLKTMTRATDAWFRSGVFLQLMKYGMKAAIGAKRLQDRSLTNPIAEAVVQPGKQRPS